MAKSEKSQHFFHTISLIKFSLMRQLVNKASGHFLQNQVDKINDVSL